MTIIEMKRYAAAAILFLLAAATQRLIAQEKGFHSSSPLDVKAEDLLTRPVGENWSSYNGDYTGRRYSTLAQINRSNVGSLAMAWAFQTHQQAMKSTPLAVNSDQLKLEHLQGTTPRPAGRPPAPG